MWHSHKACFESDIKRYRRGFSALPLVIPYALLLIGIFVGCSELGRGSNAVFVSGNKRFTLREIRAGALGIASVGRGEIRVLDSLDTLVPSSSWFDADWVLRQWGTPQEDVAGGGTGGTQGERYAGRTVTYLGGVPRAQPSDALARTLARHESNYVSMTSFDGVVTSVIARRETKSLQTYMDSDKFKLGNIPLFGKLVDLKSVLGEPIQYLGPNGDSSMAEWYILAGARPNRIAVSITASLVGDVPKGVTIRFAFESR